MTGGTGTRSIARWALGGAALVAALSIGFAISRDGDSGMPAESAAEQGQPSVSEVIARLEKRLADSPDDAEGWRMLGWAYFQTGRHAEAATAFRRATSLDPDNAVYWSMLGEALVLASRDGEGLPADAEAAFDKALALDPGDPRARYFRAVAMDLDGRHGEAIEAWFALLADTPADAPWANDVRQVIADVGKANGIDVADRLAKAEFAPATGGFQTDGAATATAGIPGPTQEDMQAAQSMSPSEQQDMIRGMVDRLAAKLKEDPLNPDGWIMLMRSRVQLGDMAGAREARDEALRLFRNEGTTSRRLREAAAALGL
ncbi:tetratricopeptide repeat protein [Croceicoccus bisphenolivorans]|uniref:tetratricopeptide repeat protein n=1 Tax=Croceicoccus bisphenolivorans TaxID=1783232 RepID=UPI00082E6A8D|nr:tetratricopeptide repeat protein [Croceicoccus bisphenolivorans]